MKSNKIFIVSLILLAIFTLNAVSASDNITDDVQTVENIDDSIHESLNTDEILQSDVDDDKLSANDSNMKVDFVKQDTNTDKISKINPEKDLYVNNHDTDYFRVKFPTLVTGQLVLNIDGKDLYTKEIFAKTHYLFVNTKSYGLNDGNHTWKITYSGDDEYNQTSASGTFYLNPAADLVKKNPRMNVYVVTKDSYNAIYAIDENKDITVKNMNTDYFKISFKRLVSGKLSLYIDNQLKSEKKIKSKTHYFFANAEEYKLPAGKHTWKIIYSGDDEYNQTSANGTFRTNIINKKVPTNKTQAKLGISKTKIFKRSTKTKKYRVTLKANKKAMKNVKVYLKISGKKYKKTFSARTNKKGIATFRITKLTKKGKYSATVTYKGNKNYKSVTTKLTIQITKKKCKITKGKTIYPQDKIEKISSSDLDGFVDVDDVYKYMNEFRTEKGVWQWDKNDVDKTFFNTNASNTLKPLEEDPILVKVAEDRLEEVMEIWYNTGKLKHERPDGSKYSTAYPTTSDGYWGTGENLARGQTTAKEVVETWKETKDPYLKQGHRRNMLNPNFNTVGIVAYKFNGMIFWIQSFGIKSEV